MRCPNCNKFVPYEDPHEVEPEGDAELNNNSLTVQVRVLLKCAECGEELKDAYVEAEETVDYDETHHDHDVSIETDDPEPLNKVEGRGRGMKTFYGFNLHYRVVCDQCKVTIAEGDLTGYEQAGAMNELS